MYDFSAFDNFIASTNGQTIGEGECWDYINLIWNHLSSKYWTYPPSDPSATNHGVKWGVLNDDALTANQIGGLTYISNVENLKRGDIVITTGGTYGHGGFIDSDYNSSQTNYNFYTQNYNNRRSVALDTYTLSEFGGAFRVDVWQSTPTPITNVPVSKFKWFLIARKLHER